MAAAAAIIYLDANLTGRAASAVVVDRNGNDAGGRLQVLQLNDPAAYDPAASAADNLTSYVDVTYDVTMGSMLFVSITYSLPMMIFVAVTLSLLVVVTAFGNLLVCLALFRYRNLHTIVSLRVGPSGSWLVID